MMDDLIDFFMMKIMMPILILLLIAFLIGFPIGFYCMYKDSKSPTFTLKKNEWSCTASHLETQTYYVMAGKVIVPQTRTDTVCDNYQRISED